MKLIVKMSGQEARMALEGGSLLKLIESVTEERATPEPEKKEAPKKKAAKKSKPTLVPDPEPAPAPAPTPASVPEPPATPVEPEPEQPIVEAPAPAPAPAAPAPVQAYTIDDIQKAAVALVNKGKMADLQALLKEFNVSAITQLPDDMQVRAAFMHRVEVIGGQA